MANASDPESQNSPPQAIQRYAIPFEHGGWHLICVHEFVTSVVQQRPSAVDAVTAARWTAAGSVRHESAMRHGAVVQILDFWAGVGRG